MWKNKKLHALAIRVLNFFICLDAFVVWAMLATLGSYSWTGDSGPLLSKSIPETDFFYGFGSYAQHTSFLFWMYGFLALLILVKEFFITRINLKLLVNTLMLLSGVFVSWTVVRLW